MAELLVVERSRRPTWMQKASTSLLLWCIRFPSRVERSSCAKTTRVTASVLVQYGDDSPIPLKYLDLVERLTCEGRTMIKWEQSDVLIIE